MVKTFLKVVEEFDSSKNYGVKIRPQFGNVLSTLKEDQIVNPDEFIKENLDKFTKGKRSFGTNRLLTYHAFGIGKKIGILKPMPQKDTSDTISFDDFCKLETVSYFIQQLRGSRFKNLKKTKMGSTQYAYANKLWAFNNWLHGQEFDLSLRQEYGVSFLSELAISLNHQFRIDDKNTEALFIKHVEKILNKFKVNLQPSETFELCKFVLNRLVVLGDMFNLIH